MISPIIYTLAALVGVLYPLFVWTHITGQIGSILAVIGHAIGVMLIWITRKKLRRRG